jgi:hypothetical protein
MVITPMSQGVMTNDLQAPGVRVHISDASPRGFSGRVMAVHPGALTVARDDSGAWELVILSRRQVTAVSAAWVG